MSDSTGERRRVALVTGANKGIGREVARQLAVAGFTVIATARDAERGGAAVRELVAEGAGDLRFLRLDVTDQETVAEAARFVETNFAGLDVLVNNAGITGITRGQRKELDELTVDDLRAPLETNFVGVFAVTQAMLPMLRKASGRVVNLTSTLATFGRVVKEGPQRADLLPYLTAKAAANMASVVYAAALREAGVTVHAVSPGYIATDMNNFAGTKSVEEGARVVVGVATTGELPERALLVESGTLPW
ncbi:SDR family NAD(P)-dependent oxidoreductase [Amycolatopsis sp. H20-H5]|uniref:SDR family NAD(P)-dependent oxidoreductase n=1 Tax=Amycolatopsis sp. H20-H5 TaxID=3046309 RepID=UPI002DBDF2E6|nr:SDR family NAD(P)-dependent oxidoreductase [Amycolatopsis sp. H20-H5]MEC3975012.1 SDR family NAD(P)-dependent oxidoreductase [Amycolatopsis sp. H20-H5]